MSVYGCFRNDFALFPYEGVLRIMSLIRHCFWGLYTGTGLGLPSSGRGSGGAVPGTDATLDRHGTLVIVGTTTTTTTEHEHSMSPAVGRLGRWRWCRPQAA